MPFFTGHGDRRILDATFPCCAFSYDQDGTISPGVLWPRPVGGPIVQWLGAPPSTSVVGIEVDGEPVGFQRPAGGIVTMELSASPPLVITITSCTTLPVTRWPRCTCQWNPFWIGDATRLTCRECGRIFPALVIPRSATWRPVRAPAGRRQFHHEGDPGEVFEGVPRDSLTVLVPGMAHRRDRPDPRLTRPKAPTGRDRTARHPTPDPAAPPDTGRHQPLIRACSRRACCVLMLLGVVDRSVMQ